MCLCGEFFHPPLCKILICTLCEGDVSGGDKSKKGVKRKKISEESGETAKRRSARVRNTKCKKEEKVDFQELLVKFLPSRYCAHFLIGKNKPQNHQSTSPVISLIPSLPFPLGTSVCSCNICASV